MTGLFMPQPPPPRLKLKERGLYLQSGNIGIMKGDVTEQLSLLPDNYFHAAVTSPPYFGLRSYLPDDHPDKNKEIGGEPSHYEYVEKLVQVFSQVKRVLRQDGTFWLNIGDSYNSHNRTFGVKNKDLIGVPWELAFALRDDGWYLRSAVIWHKLKIAPDSAPDRPGNCYELIFMLTKTDEYYWDSEAVREAGTMPAGMTVKGGKKRRDMSNGNALNSVASDSYFEYDGTRKIRNVWTANPHVASDAHYALMPEDIIEPCVFASTSEYGCCDQCGAPWGRTSSDVGGKDPDRPIRRPRRKGDGWEQSCECIDSEVVPCDVLDPFGGLGTVGMTAAKHARNATMIELSSDFIVLMKKRFDEERLAYYDKIVNPIKPTRMIIR